MMLTTGGGAIKLGTFLLIDGTKTLTPEKDTTALGPWRASSLVFGIFGSGAVTIDNVSITLGK